MAKKKPRPKPGQRKGDQHYTPPKQGSVLPAAPKVENQIQASEATDAPQDQNGAQAKETVQTIGRHILLDSILTGVIAAATVVQVGVAWFQWSAMDATIDVMRADQRPWLGAENPPTAEVAQSQDIAEMFPLKNFGRTPAKLIGSTVIAVIKKPGEDIEADVKEARALASGEGGVLNSIVPPGVINRFTPNERGRLPPATIEKVLSGAEKLYFIHVTYYTDLAGSRYKTELCWVYDANHKAFHIHNKYNDMQ